MVDYAIGCDVELVQELLEMNRSDLAVATGISLPTLNRWVADSSRASLGNIERFYAFAHKRGLRLNAIKAQLYQEEYSASPRKVLFHGSKSGIEGPVSVGRSRKNNDFGQGFYCGESFAQSAMFVSGFPDSSVYAVAFDEGNLSPVHFAVDRDWMLTIALHRGRLADYAEHPFICALRQRVEAADYVVAPIADNRMYEIIDSFADGELTDEQCKHALAATNLGSQYVIRSEKAVEAMSFVEHCYLCAPEKESYAMSREEASRVGRDKVKAAKRAYRGMGRYIDEVLQ